MQKIIKYLSRKRMTNTIGLAMLDIVCNGLCATFLLFVLVSAMQLQKPPLQRVMGMLYIELKFTPDDEIGMSVPGIYLKYMDANKIYFDEALNDDNRGYERLAPRASTLPPKSMIYQDINDPFNRIIVMHNPIAGIYNPRIYHIDHNKYQFKPYGGDLMLQAHFLKPGSGSSGGPKTVINHFEIEPFHERVKFTTEAPSPNYLFLMEEPKPVY